MNEPHSYRDKRAYDFGRLIATLLVMLFFGFIVGTLLGLWIKLFWIGWVFA